MRSADTPFPRSGELNGDLGGLNAPIPELRQRLLAWCQQHGRHTIPWKRRADGRPAADGEPLDPYAIWVAEADRG
jgi:adenine-specific DNA glycosylase